MEGYVVLEVPLRPEKEGTLRWLLFGNDAIREEM
jgi:hypothetical protein